MQRFPRVLLTYNQFRAPPKFLFSFLFFFSPLPLRFLNPDRFADLFAQRGGRAGGRGGGGGGGGGGGRISRAFQKCAETVGRDEISACSSTEKRSHTVFHVLCARRPSAGSRVLLDPRSRCSGSATGPPRRYSGSKTFTLAETVRNGACKDKKLWTR